MNVICITVLVWRNSEIGCIDPVNTEYLFFSLPAYNKNDLSFLSGASYLLNLPNKRNERNGIMYQV